MLFGGCTESTERSLNPTRNLSPSYPGLQGGVSHLPTEGIDIFRLGLCWLIPFLFSLPCIPVSVPSLRLNFQEAESLSPCPTHGHSSPGPPHDVTHPIRTREIFEKKGPHYHFIPKLLRTDLGGGQRNYVFWASDSLYFILHYFARYQSVWPQINTIWMTPLHDLFQDTSRLWK